MMAETQELQESQIVEEGSDSDNAPAGEAPGSDAQPSAGPFKKSRGKRPTVKAVENKATEIEQRLAELADQVAQLGRRLTALEASQEGTQTDKGAGDGESQLVAHLRQLDERVQKLADFVTEQAWATSRG